MAVRPIHSDVDSRADACASIKICNDVYRSSRVWINRRMLRDASDVLVRFCLHLSTLSSVEPSTLIKQCWNKHLKQAGCMSAAHVRSTCSKAWRKEHAWLKCMLAARAAAAHAAHPHSHLFHQEHVILPTVVQYAFWSFVNSSS